MGEKLKTEHKDHAPIEMAPDDMQPFINIDDMSGWAGLDKNVTSPFNPPDTGRDAAIRNILADEEVMGNDWIGGQIQKHYDDYYYFYEAPTEKQLEKQLKEGEKELDRFQKKEDEQAENEARPRVDYAGNEAVRNQFIQNYLENERKKGLDQSASAALGFAASEMPSGDILSVTTKNAADKEQKNAELVCAMMEVIENLAAASFEYLVRGATMACSCGGMWRKLNLPKDHGLFYGTDEIPAINGDDCEVGDAFNITNFAICGGIDPPEETVELEDLVISDELGRFLVEQDDDTVKRGHRCMPEVAGPGWHNTFKVTEIGGTGQNKAGVSTQSFLICIHGGIIYPVNSGQHSDIVILNQEDLELNDTFNGLYADYQALEPEREAIEALQQPYKDAYGQTVIPISTDKDLARLRDIYNEQETYLNKMNSVMNRAREDGYKGKYENIPDERRATLESMLEDRAKLTGGEGADVPSIKSDYYDYRRGYGYTEDSIYNQDGLDFNGDSDAYTDWRVGRLENKKQKQAEEEFKAWENDVNDKGYDNLDPYEKEAYDRANAKYGK